ncbi:MAG: phage terminase large subunit, partial [Cetobacterium sp.]
FIETYAKNKYHIYILTGAARTGKTQTVASVFLEDILSSNINDVFAIGTQSKGTFESVITKAFYQYDDSIDVKQTQGGNYRINGREVLSYTYSDKGMGEKKRGATIKTAWMDEAQSCPYPVFNDLLGRLSRSDSKMFITSNPSGASHWIYTNFILNTEQRGRYNIKSISENRKSIVFPSTMDEYRVSNGGHINDDYVDMLLSLLPEIEIRRLVYGEHVDAIGRIFDISKLQWYNGDRDDGYDVKALIDPAYGEKNCFTACILYQIKQGEFYLLDSGLLRSNSIQTMDDVIIEFLRDNKINKVAVESNFNPDLGKKLAREFEVKKFYVNQDKIKRIINQSINIRKHVYFPLNWKEVPNTAYDKWLQSSHGRGYIGLSQLLNFSDIERENCIRGQDLTFVDFPDALASILNIEKTEIVDDFEVKNILDPFNQQNDWINTNEFM